MFCCVNSQKRQPNIKYKNPVIQASQVAQVKKDPINDVKGKEQEQKQKQKEKIQQYRNAQIHNQDIVSQEQQVINNQNQKSLQIEYKKEQKQQEDDEQYEQSQSLQPLQQIKEIKQGSSFNSIYSQNINKLLQSKNIISQQSYQIQNTSKNQQKIIKTSDLFQKQPKINALVRAARLNQREVQAFHPGPLYTQFNIKM